MNRIDKKLQQLKKDNRKALIPYVVAGDPNPEVTLPLMHALVAKGADILELGVPFSDPMAEGPVIQLAHERALLHKMSLRKIFTLVKEFRATNSETPIVLMGYANPVEVMGYKAFSDSLAEAQIDGVLLVDMPPEEGETLNAALKSNGIHSIYLIAPTTTNERAKKIIQSASGYLYYVSLKGVTGAGLLQLDEVKQRLTDISAMTDLPICVGFGIKDAQSAAQLGSVASGVIVGSVLVNTMAQLQNEAPDVIAVKTANILEDMRVALDELSQS